MIDRPEGFDGWTRDARQAWIDQKRIELDRQWEQLDRLLRVLLVTTLASPFLSLAGYLAASAWGSL